MGRVPFPAAGQVGAINLQLVDKKTACALDERKIILLYSGIHPVGLPLFHVPFC
jgi:hypothetical protein